MSNLMAMLLQTLLGAAGHRHRAWTSPRPAATNTRAPVSWSSGCCAEIAIAACDLAEVLGSAIALKLLFGIPLLLGRAASRRSTSSLLLLLQRRASG